MTYKFLILHKNPELVTPTALLLNDEWPRSLDARLHFLNQADENFPISLVLLDNGEVIGHARLRMLQQDSSELMIESVVIKKTLRGKGLGRKLMEMTEDYAIKRLGAKSICLTTRDKQEFYKKLGYLETRPKHYIRGKVGEKFKAFQLLNHTTNGTVAVPTGTGTHKDDTASGAGDTHHGGGGGNKSLLHSPAHPQGHKLIDNDLKKLKISQNATNNLTKKTLVSDVSNTKPSTTTTTTTKPKKSSQPPSDVNKTKSNKSNQPPPDVNKTKPNKSSQSPPNCHPKKSKPPPCPPPLPSKSKDKNVIRVDSTWMEKHLLS